MSLSKHNIHYTAHERLAGRQFVSGNVEQGDRAATSLYGSVSRLSTTITDPVSESTAIAPVPATKADPPPYFARESTASPVDPASLAPSTASRMTTRLHDVIEVDAHGLLKICSWCVSRERRLELRQLGFQISDGICPACQAKFEAPVDTLSDTRFSELQRKLGGRRQFDREERTALCP